MRIGPSHTRMGNYSPYNLAFVHVGRQLIYKFLTYSILLLYDSYMHHAFTYIIYNLRTRSACKGVWNIYFHITIAVASYMFPGELKDWGD